jgi:hypothetical protein
MIVVRVFRYCYNIFVPGTKDAYEKEKETTLVAHVLNKPENAQGCYRYRH